MIIGGCAIPAAEQQHNVIWSVVPWVCRHNFFQLLSPWCSLNGKKASSQLYICRGVVRRPFFSRVVRRRSNIHLQLQGLKPRPDFFLDCQIYEVQVRGGVA